MQIYRDNHMAEGYRYQEPFGARSPIRHCGEAVCTRGFAVDWHAHDCVEVCYLARGSLKFQLSRQRFEQVAGQAAIALPGQRHRLSGSGAGPYQILFVGFDLRVLEGSPIGRSLPEIVEVQGSLLPVYSALEPVLRGIIHQAVGRQPRRHVLARYYLRTATALMVQAAESALLDHSRDASLYSFPVTAAMNYLQARLNETATLADVALAAGLSPNYLCQQFAAEVGETPMRYHRRLRLEAARNLLVQSSLSVTQIAMRFSFSSPQHFCQAFSENYGVSPQSFRQQHQQ